MVDVYEAVTSRRAVRGFTDQPVPREVLERVLSAAAWSPSGSNLQPWNIYVVTGALRVPESDLRVFGRRLQSAELGVALATAPDVATARDRARQVANALNMRDSRG